ncbi:MAG: isoprenyl transferase [Lachnospiraceae bacterium]|nr:isoprenyl transferase [Lachnospiraceae bacterium]
MDIRNEKLGLVTPCHVAIIMDGNGRWAKKRHMPRTYGHAAGASNVKSVVRIADDIGIQYLTIYAFSTENWKRSAQEVSALMTLLKKYLHDYIGECNENNVRCRIIGRREGLREDLLEEIVALEEATKNNTGLQFTIAINYGGRDEITRAVQEIAKEAAAGQIAPEAITEETISRHLDTKDLPDPDLLIRTSGEERLSNYLPWQLAYTEFYFTDVYWPDFGREELIEAVKKYNQRDRRFGGVKS